MSQTVRAVVARAVGEPVSAENIVVPDPGPGEAVVKIQAKKPVRTHLVHVQDDTVFVTLSEDEPNLPPGLTVGGAS